MKTYTLTDRQKTMRRIILDAYKDHIFKITDKDTQEEIVVHDLLKTRIEDEYMDAEKGEQGVYRCMNTQGEWKQCIRKLKEMIADEIALQKEKSREGIINNPYGVYIIITGDKFRIADKTKETKKTKQKGDAKDRRGVFRGKVCTAGWKKSELVELGFRIGIQLQNDTYASWDVDTLKEKLRLNGYQDIADKTDDKDTLVSIYTLQHMRNPSICEHLKQWFMDHGLAVYEN